MASHEKEMDEWSVVSFVFALGAKCKSEGRNEYEGASPSREVNNIKSIEKREKWISLPFVSIVFLDWI